MFTPPPGSNVINTCHTYDYVAKDYVQKVLVSQIIVDRYEAVHLEKIVMPYGTIYDSQNPNLEEGSVYTNNIKMGKDIAGGVSASGIHNANFGLNTSKYHSQHPDLFPFRVAHHSWGGNTATVCTSMALNTTGGTVSIYNTIGNEFSHEMGHTYGIWHYP